MPLNAPLRVTVHGFYLLFPATTDARLPVSGHCFWDPPHVNVSLSIPHRQFPSQYLGVFSHPSNLGSLCPTNNRPFAPSA